jgi:hypothetical protein
MARRIFISYQHDDQMKAKGFNLLRWNKNVKLDCVGRHLLDPVDSTNEAYVTGKVKEQITGTSVTVVLIGKNTASSEWVADEVKWSLEKENPNGILGVCLEPGCEVPQALIDCGAEIVEWDPHSFEGAIERAAKAASRAKAVAVAVGGGSCSR